MCIRDRNTQTAYLDEAQTFTRTQTFTNDVELFGAVTLLDHDHTLSVRSGDAAGADGDDLFLFRVHANSDLPEEFIAAEIDVNIVEAANDDEITEMIFRTHGADTTIHDTLILRGDEIIVPDGILLNGLFVCDGTLGRSTVAEVAGATVESSASPNLSLIHISEPTRPY